MQAGPDRLGPGIPEAKGDAAGTTAAPGAVRALLPQEVETMSDVQLVVFAINNKIKLPRVADRAGMLSCITRFCSGGSSD